MYNFARADQRKSKDTTECILEKRDMTECMYAGKVVIIVMHKPLIQCVVHVEAIDNPHVMSHICIWFYILSVR